MGHALALLLIVLFAVPCIACDDAAGSRLRRTAPPAPAVSLSHADGIHDAAPHDASPCGCLSDASKVRADRFSADRLLPDAAVALATIAPPLPNPIRLAPASSEPRPRRTIGRLQCDGRAPPV